jgi:hypothetical protein
MVEYNYTLLEQFVRETEAKTKKAVEVRFSNGGRREIYATLDRRAGLYKVEFVNDFGREHMDSESTSLIDSLEEEPFGSLDHLKSEIKIFYDYSFVHDEKGLYFAEVNNIVGSEIGSIMKPKIRIVAPLLQDGEDPWISMVGDL